MPSADTFYVNAKTQYIEAACGADTRHTSLACFITDAAMSLQIAGGGVGGLILHMTKILKPSHGRRPPTRSDVMVVQR